MDETAENLPIKLFDYLHALCYLLYMKTSSMCNKMFMCLLLCTFYIQSTSPDLSAHLRFSILNALKLKSCQARSLLNLV
ncbi:unnamed protein product [Hermetia illucens]|uniref:Uncharacterized protein n=1 Tax=Hermetia illucens TaxID=343691 RepID=A0A7R8YZ12_HERIL|nr:unnamed protein product [Hermetia illucens]